MFPEDVSGSLTSLAKYFNIPVDENKAHDAKYDTELTFQVFMKLREQMMGQTTVNELGSKCGWGRDEELG